MSFAAVVNKGRTSIVAKPDPKQPVKPSKVTGVVPSGVTAVRTIGGVSYVGDPGKLK